MLSPLWLEGMFTIFSIFLLTSCDKAGRMMSSLTDVDSLFYDHPDSAFAMLKDMRAEVATMDEEARIYYDLLTVRGTDKIYKKHTSDSLIMKVVDYYEQQGDWQKLGMAYYYAGRVCADVDKNSRRHLYYTELALACDTLWMNDYWRSRLFAQKGYVFLRNGLYEEARDMQEMARIFCRNIGDTLGVRYSTEDIATINQMMQRTQRDTTSLVAMRQSCNMLVERAHNKVLRLQNEMQKKKVDEGSDMTPWLVMAGALLTALGMWIWRRRKNNVQTGMSAEPDVAEQDEEASSHPLPPNHRSFYDAEVDEVLRSHLKADKALRPTEWRMVEERLLEAFPHFRSTLYSLYELSETEYRICMLIKMDTTPSNMARLLAMGASSVSQSRLRMQQKVFGGSGTAKDWDAFVHSL